MNTPTQQHTGTRLMQPCPIARQRRRDQARRTVRNIGAALMVVFALSAPAAAQTGTVGDAPVYGHQVFGAMVMKQETPIR